MADYLEGFAEKKIIESYKANETCFLLGSSHPDHGLNIPVGINDDRHLFIMAGSRSGKGTSMLITNLINWMGGVFCVDPKGENASITACRRGDAVTAKKAKSNVSKFLGQKVAILDPMGTVKGAAKTYRIAYDPLNDVDIGTDDEVRQIKAIGEALVMSDGDKDSHWTDGARMILEGIIEAVLHNEKDKPENQSLAFVRSIYQSGLSGAALEYLRKSPITNGGLALDAVALIEDAGEDEAGSFSTTLARQLQFLSDPRMQRHLKNDGFSLTKAVRENWSVYICIPPSQIDRMKRWLRILIRVGLDAKMFAPEEHQGQQSLFLLDEFSSLGKMKEIETSAAYMAGYGIKLVPVIQNIGQIKEIYNKNWETFLGNAGAIIAWGLNDLDSEKYVSDRLGNVLTYEISASTSASTPRGAWRASSVSESQSAALHERPVRRPNEVHYEGARETGRAFIIPAKGEPFMVMRRNYHETKHYPTSYYDSPEYIRQWELKHG
jgi:type IV secretion system protein VirD4